MGTLGDWQKVKEAPLGQGGQSTVYLVRTPERSKARKKALERMGRYSPTNSSDDKAETWQRHLLMLHVTTAQAN
jgi:hypothetical protein